MTSKIHAGAVTLEVIVTFKELARHQSMLTPVGVKSEQKFSA